MKKIIVFLFKWFTGEAAEDVIRNLVTKYLPGYHVHRDPPKRKGQLVEISGNPTPEGAAAIIRRQAD